MEVVGILSSFYRGIRCTAVGKVRKFKSFLIQKQGINQIYKNN